MTDLPSVVVYKKDFEEFTLHRNDGIRINRFSIVDLELAQETSSRKRPAARTSVKFHLKRNDGHPMTFTVYPVAGTYSRLPDTKKEYYLFEATMTAPTHPRLYLCLVDTLDSPSPGYV